MPALLLGHLAVQVALGDVNVLCGRQGIIEGGAHFPPPFRLRRATESAIAIAWARGRPAAISVLMFADTATLLLPCFSGIILTALNGAYT